MDNCPVAQGNGGKEETSRSSSDRQDDVDGAVNKKSCACWAFWGRQVGPRCGNEVIKSAAVASQSP